jgi:hypothetical protein
LLQHDPKSGRKTSREGNEAPNFVGRRERETFCSVTLIKWDMSILFGSQSH